MFWFLGKTKGPITLKAFMKPHLNFILGQSTYSTEATKKIRKLVLYN